MTELRRRLAGHRRAGEGTGGGVAERVGLLAEEVHGDAHARRRREDDRALRPVVVLGQQREALARAEVVVLPVERHVARILVPRDVQHRMGHRRRSAHVEVRPRRAARATGPGRRARAAWWTAC